MRLTEKDGTLKLESITDIKWNDAIKKLGQLEDIEEELGIDLVTLFKAFKEGIYVKDDYSHEAYDIEIYKDEYNRFSLTTEWRQDNLLLKDYGKTWALTKEELE